MALSVQVRTFVEVSGFSVQVLVFLFFPLTPDPPPAEHLKP
jgi:hypothetical protein